MTGIKREKSLCWSYAALFSQTNNLQGLAGKKKNGVFLSEVKSSTLESNNYRLVTQDFDVSHITVTW